MRFTIARDNLLNVNNRNTKIKVWKIYEINCHWSRSGVFMNVFHWQFLITYIFSISLKFRACYIITDQWGEFTAKNATLYLHVLSWHFFVVFHQKICVLINFIFFWWSIKFRQQNINQSKARIGDKKLSMELYVIVNLERGSLFASVFLCQFGAGNLFHGNVPLMKNTASHKWSLFLSKLPCRILIIDKFAIIHRG